MQGLDIKIKDSDVNEVGQFIKDSYTLIDKYNGAKLPEGTLFVVSMALFDDESVNDMFLIDISKSISHLTKKLVQKKTKGEAVVIEPVTLKEYTLMPLDQMFIRVLTEYKYYLASLERQKTLPISEKDLNEMVLTNEFKESYSALKLHITQYGYLGLYLAFITFYQSNWRLYNFLKGLAYTGDKYSNIEEELFNTSAETWKAKRMSNPRKKQKDVDAFLTAVGLDEDAEDNEEIEKSDRRSRAGAMMYVKIECHGFSHIIEQGGFKEYLNKMNNAKKGTE